MRTTKNVTIRENNAGFAVRNNNETVCTVGSYAEAKEVAIAIAEREGKGVVANTEYYHEVVR